MFESWKNMFALSAKQNFYYINDPSTPSLCEDQALPPKTAGLPVAVNQPIEPLSIGCRMTISRGIEAFQAAISKIDKPLMEWQKKSALLVFPRKKAVKINAYYNRRELVFFNGKNPKTKKEILLAESADIVAHELGHALLDAFKPELWNMQGFEIWGFHEAFADIQAIVTTMQSDIALEYILEETNTDLMASNVCSRLGEELGKAISEKNYLRDASIPYKYVDPKTLPRDKNVADLSSECHSLGRIFTSAWYRIMVKIYNFEKQNMSPLLALKKARDISYYYLIRAVKQAPITMDYFRSIAKHLLLADQMTNNLYADLIEEVLSDWNLLRTEVMAQGILTWGAFTGSLRKNDVVVRKGGYTTVSKKRTRRTSLSNHFVRGLGGDSKLFNATIQIPLDEFYQFDNNGQLTDMFVPNEAEVIAEAAQCVNKIALEGYGKDQLWNLDEHDLIRNFID